MEYTGTTIYNFGDKNNFPAPSKKMIAHFDAGSRCINRGENVLDVFYGTIGPKTLFKTTKYAFIITDKRVIATHDTLKGGYSGRIAKYFYPEVMDSIEFDGNKITFTKRLEKDVITVDSHNYDNCKELIESLGSKLVE